MLVPRPQLSVTGEGLCWALTGLPSQQGWDLWSGSTCRARPFLLTQLEPELESYWLPHRCCKVVGCVSWAASQFWLLLIPKPGLMVVEEHGLVAQGPACQERRGGECCVRSGWICCQDWTDCHSCLCCSHSCEELPLYGPLCIDTVFVCRGAGLELIKTGSRCLPDIALAVALTRIYPPCARRAPSPLIRVSVRCTLQGCLFPELLFC